MTKFSSKISAAAFGILALGSAAIATPAAAHDWDHHWNAPLVGGLAGGLLLGAIVANANAPSYAPDYVSDCRRVRTPIYNEYGDFVGYRRVRVCD
jgi:hypothetical protein